MEPCLALIFTDRGRYQGGAPLIRRVEIARPHVANVDIGHSLEFSKTKFVRNTNCVEHQVVQKKPTKPFVNVVTM